TLNYDKVGNLTQITDALGRVTSLAYDNRNSLVRDDAFGSSVQRSATMIYDAVGNLLSETVGIATTNPQVLTTSFAYDGADRVTAAISAFGVTGVQRTNTIVYDKAGNIANTIDGLNQKSQFPYDALNPM